MYSDIMGGYEMEKKKKKVKPHKAFEALWQE